MKVKLIRTAFQKDMIKILKGKKELWIACSPTIKNYLHENVIEGGEFEMETKEVVDYIKHIKTTLIY